MTDERYTGRELKDRRAEVIVRLRDEQGLKFSQIAPQVNLTERGTEVAYYKAKGKKG